MNRSSRSAFGVTIMCCSLSVATGAGAQVTPTLGEPRAPVFASFQGVDLKAYVFSPSADRTGEPRSAIVLFYGGGWAQGEPALAFARARHFAEQGMVAVAAEYRLSDQKSITPIEAMADARPPVLHRQAGFQKEVACKRRQWDGLPGRSSELESE